MGASSVPPPSEVSTVVAEQDARSRRNKTSGVHLRGSREGAFLADDQELEDGSRVICRIAGGATSEVFMIRLMSGARRALKVLGPRYSQEGPGTPFHCALRAYTRLRCPFVPRFYGTRRVVKDGDERLCLELELASGGSLLQRLRRGPIGYADVFELARQLFGGLAQLHDQGIVHADIKPGNLLFRDRHRKPHLWLVDFGISRDISETDGGVRYSLFGTPSFMPPEQILHGFADQRSDIYSACVVLYAAITERRPFRGPNPDAIMLAVVEHDLKPIRHWRPECPKALAELIEAGLDADRSSRPRSARVALDALTAAHRQWCQTGPLP